MKLNRSRLFTPGPTPIPDFILRKFSEPIIHHRKPEFESIFSAVRQGLKHIFQTDNEVFVLTASGTGAMEAAVVNLATTGDLVITVDAGKFGERWTELCHTYGIQTVVIKKEWGDAVQPEEIIAALKKNSAAKAVYLTYSETSTGVAIDLPTIARAIRQNSEALIVVDAISALVALPLKMDEWGLDVVVSASQKGFMLPPGLAFIALSAPAHEIIQKSELPKFYLSLKKANKSVGSGTTPFTPASTIIIGLNESINYLKEKGMETVWREHAVFAAAIRSAMQACGLNLFTKFPSNAVSAVCCPPEIDYSQLTKLLQNQFGIIIAGGQGQIKGKVFRIGHVGYYDALDIISFVSAMELVLMQLRWKFEPGAGLLAAQKEIMKLFPG